MTEKNFQKIDKTTRVKFKTDLVKLYKQKSGDDGTDGYYKFLDILSGRTAWVARPVKHWNLDRFFTQLSGHNVEDELLDNSTYTIYNFMIEDSVKTIRDLSLV